jgi:hypothetical protein
MGVPDSSTRRLHTRLSSARLVSVASFLRRCASSQMSRSQAPCALNLSACRRKVSYEMMSTCRVEVEVGEWCGEWWLW